MRNINCAIFRHVNQEMMTILLGYGSQNNSGKVMTNFAFKLKDNSQAKD
jgi:hypothetical protein